MYIELHCTGGISLDVQITRRDWLFLLICLGLGILAEISFFHGKIGLSYPVFIAGFYLVLFLKYRHIFEHRRIGLLLMLAIWILAGSFLFFDSMFFYRLNLVIIPWLVFFHIVLITSSNQLLWGKPVFLVILMEKLWVAVQYNYSFFKRAFLKGVINKNKQSLHVIKRIIIGLVIGVPLLLVITFLLMSADAIFQNLLLQLPEFIIQFSYLEELSRVIVVMMLTLLFFGVFQVLQVKTEIELEHELKRKSTDVNWDGIITITILVLLNTVYVLFTIIQFTYFFNDGLQEGFTYAEYARRGFFELISVTLINWTLLISFLKRVRTSSRSIDLTLKIMYSLLIVVSGVMLVSAYQRLSLYETAYGFTVDRILAHAVMIFLMVIFAYTLIRVWIERLALLHFYLIAGLIFYVALNMVQIEQMVVDNNLERYQETGKIDVVYLNTLSYTGLNGLMELYEMDPEYPDLQGILEDRKRQLDHFEQESWQSFNFAKEKGLERIKGFDLNKFETEGNQ